MNEIIDTKAAPAAIGPYSQAIRCGAFLFVSGQIPLDPATGLLVAGDIVAQTEQVMKNLKGILNAAGMDFANVVRCSCFLANMDDFGRFNETYERCLGGNKPTREAMQVAKLPKGAGIEISVIGAA